MTNFRREGDFSSLGIDQNPVDHPGAGRDRRAARFLKRRE